MGKMGGFLNPANDAVKGTGQTVGDLKDIGYSDAEIGDMGTSGGNKFARGLLKGSLSGLAAQGQQGGQQGGQPVQFDVSSPQLPSDFFGGGSYLDQEIQRRRMKQVPNSQFYGG